VLEWIRLPDPSDGGVNVLQHFFARSDTTLTKVAFLCCNLESREDALQLIGVFQTNRTVTDLTIYRISILNGAVLGACLSSLTQNMTQLQRLECSSCALRAEGVRAFRPALQANRTLRELILWSCNIRDEGIGIIADALAGNTTIEILDIRGSGISSNGLPNIARLIETTRIKKIDLGHNGGIFNGVAATLRFARVLSRHEFVKELTLPSCDLGDKDFRLIADGLVGNTSWNPWISVKTTSLLLVCPISCRLSSRRG
jgi:Leucine Rich repeat